MSSKIILDFFDGSAKLNIVFFLLAIISIIISIIFYYRSLREKRPVYNTATFNLGSDLKGLKNIEVKCNNKIVNNISLTRIAIWNSGKEPIRDVDIVQTDPLKIVSESNILIYDIEITYAKAVNNIVLQHVGNIINIKFDYLDFYDGLVCNVYHSGFSSSDLNIKGTIIGSRKINFGLPKDFLLSKIDFISYPVNELINRKNVLARILGFFLTIPTIFVLLPFAIFIVPANYIYDKYYNKCPKEFLLKPNEYE